MRRYREHMSGAEAIHPFDMRVPAGVPLLASWWWRALIAIVLLVCAAEVARGVVFASDAISGAWLGVLMALLVPWAWWRVHPDTLPGVRPAAAWVPSP